MSREALVMSCGQNEFNSINLVDDRNGRPWSEMVRLVIRPLSLSFNVQEIEAKYARHRTESLHLLSDRSLVFITLPLLLTFVAFECTGQTDTSSLATGVASLLTYALQWLLMASNGRFGWERRRDTYVLLLRVLRLLVAVVGVLHWRGDVVGEEGGLFKNLALRSGVLCNVWFAWGMPLLFKRHVWVQTWSLAMLLAVPGRAVCREALISTVGGELLLARWKEIDNFFQLFTRGSPSLETPEMFTGCFQLVALIHVVLGLLVPSYILWHCELQSRREYIRTMEVLQEGPQQYILDESWVPDPARAIVLLGMSVATLWMIMSQLAV